MKECRICVFQGKARKRPFPEDLPGRLITDLGLLRDCIDKGLSIEEGLIRGMEIISRGSIPAKGIIKGAGIVEILGELYKNHRRKIEHLL